MRLSRVRSQRLRDKACALAHQEDEGLGDICRSSDEVWVVLDKGQVVACAGANLENDHPVSANLSFCVVHRDYRGRGLQARLLEARVKWARAEHCSEAKTYSHKSNTPSLLNLLKAGFEVFLYEDPYVSVRKEL